MDAFFAAIEERDKPWLKEKPIVVGADPKDGVGRGVVSTANYKAREYGIHSAQPISIAWRLSEEAHRKGNPRAIFITPSSDRYSITSREIMDYLRTKGTTVEQASIDEAYIELPGTSDKGQGNLWEEAEKMAREIKKEIWDKQKLTCSIGIGPNKFIAKVASDFKKPDGLTVVTPENVLDFLAPLSIKVIPGIGPKAQEKFSKLNIQTIQDLRSLSEVELTEFFGKWGIAMWEKARGIDDAPLVTEYTRKSIGEQITFEKDTLDAPFLVQQLQKLALSVGKYAQDQNIAFKTVSLTVRFFDFETKSRAKTLSHYTDEATMIEKIALQLLLPFFDARENPKKKPIRLLGVRIEKLLTAQRDKML